MIHLKKRPRNHLHRHDLKGLDIRLRARMRLQRRTRMALWGLLMMTGAGLLCWGTWTGVKLGMRQLFSENTVYQIAEIVVQSSGEALRPEQVSRYLRVQPGQNLFALDLTQLRRELELLPVVESAEVARELPRRLVIRITERVPIANISAGSGRMRYQIDRHGVIMDLLSARRNPAAFRERLAALPEITGANVADLKMGRAVSSGEIFHALELIQKVEQADLGSNLEIESIDISRRGMLIVNAADGVLVKIGLFEMDKQMMRLADILEDARRRSEKLATVDLTLNAMELPGKTVRPVPTTYVQ